MLNLVSIYKNYVSEPNSEFDLNVFLTLIRSKIVINEQEDSSPVSISSKEIDLLLRFFIILNNLNNCGSGLVSPGDDDNKKTQIIKFFVDDSQESALQTTDKASEAISKRIDEIIEINSSNKKVSKRLFDDITIFINSSNQDSQARADNSTSTPNEHASLSDVNIEIEPDKAIDSNKEEYQKEYQKLLDTENQIAKTLNDNAKENNSPEKYSGIGASVEYNYNEDLTQITGFKVNHVVENSHAKNLGLKEGSILNFNQPIGKDEANKINDIVNNIRNLDFSDVTFNQQELKFINIPTNYVRKQFFSTNNDRIARISSDNAMQYLNLPHTHIAPLSGPEQMEIGTKPPIIHILQP